MSPPGLFVCVYYRVAAADAARVISVVREFQRTLPAGLGVREGQVLLRCSLPPSALPSDAFPAPPSDPDPSPVTDPTCRPDEDATVMETYCIVAPAHAGRSAADSGVRSFLEALDAASAPLASLLRSARHVELFTPCVS